MCFRDMHFILLRHGEQWPPDLFQGAVLTYVTGGDAAWAL